MPILSKQLFDSSRGRIVGLLRRGNSTADQIATTIGVTRSAIRAQLSTLERDGVVRRAGQKAGTTRPSHLYELTPEVEELLSRAYIPLLTQLIDVCASSVAPDQLEKMLRQTGKKLANDLLGGKRPTGSLAARVEIASNMLNEQLGAMTRVEANGHYVIRGYGCPLAALTGKHPGVCRAMESLVTEIVGARARECCERSGRPQCCFAIRHGRGKSGAGC